jgi:hypothetical protein
MNFTGRIVIGTVLTGALLTPLQAFPQRGIERRQNNQERRIEQGIRSGELTRREVRGLVAEQRRIEREQRRAQADGVVTRREGAAIHHDLNQASRHIARQKHDRQERK